jgi:hypothetical protein
LLLDCFNVDKSKEFETFLHDHTNIYQTKVNNLQNHENENELFLIGKELTYCQLLKIISINGGAFTNTGVKTKALIIKKCNNDNYNQDIEFIELNEEVKVLGIRKLNEKLQFTFEDKKEEIINYNEDIEIKTLGEICDISYGTRIVKNNNTDGEYPVYGSGRPMFYTNTFNREGYNILIGRFALSLKCVRIITDKIFLNDSGLSIKSKIPILLDKYLGYYLLNNEEIISRKDGQNGSFELSIINGKPSFTLYSSSSSFTINALNTVNDNEWHQTSCDESINI